MTHGIARYRGAVLAMLALFLAAGFGFVDAHEAISVPHGYVLARNGGVLYGEPEQIRTIRSILPGICSGPAQPVELIQVRDYAIAEGSCGNPELHVVLRRQQGRWIVPQGCPGTGIAAYECMLHGGCHISGGVTPDYGPDGLVETLEQKCKWPASVVRQIVAVSRLQSSIVGSDASALAEERVCRANAQAYTLCPGYKPTPSQLATLTYDDNFSLAEFAAYAGDMDNAVRFAQKAASVPSLGAGMKPMLVELERLKARVASGSITRAQAAKLYDRYVLQKARGPVRRK